ncbi:unknown [Sutterella sp. CAG:351]|nr:unknown [Sutterella sp. CAG:351]
MNREVQEVSGFFQRIRAVRNHDSGHIWIGEQLVAALGKLQPDLVRHVLRTDVGNLLTGHLGVLLDLRDRVDQNLNTQVAGFIARHLSAAGSRTGNRAARGKNLDLGQCLSANSNGQADRESDQFVTEMHDVPLQFKIR